MAIHQLLSLQQDLIYNVGGAVNTLMQTGTPCALVLLVNVTRPSLQCGKVVKGKPEEWQPEAHAKGYLQEQDTDGSGAQ